MKRTALLATSGTLALLLAGVACESSSSDGSGGSGAAGGEGGATTTTSGTGGQGGATNSTSGTGGSGGEGGEGGGNGCTAIALPDLAYADFDLFGFYYEATPTPNLGSATAEDIASLEFYADATGIVDLGSDVNSNYETCDVCLAVAVDLSESPKFFFQTQGTLDLGESSVIYIAGSISDTILGEADEDLVHIEGGDCLYIAGQSFAIPRPAAGWECPPDWYDDGSECDCDCGALDPDCAISGAPVFGCEDGEVCSDQGTCVDP